MKWPARPGAALPSLVISAAAGAVERRSARHKTQHYPIVRCVKRSAGPARNPGMRGQIGSLRELFEFAKIRSTHDGDPQL
jgi:hypothetical protein